MREKITREINKFNYLNVKMAKHKILYAQEINKFNYLNIKMTTHQKSTKFNKYHK